MKRRFLAAVLLCVLLVCGCTQAYAVSSVAPDSMATAHEWRLLSLINEYRAENGQQPLSMFPALQNAAGVRANELNTLAGTNRPNGVSWTSVLSQNSIAYSSATQSYMKGLTNNASAPETIIGMLKNSTNEDVEPFRAAILNGTFTHIGIGSTASGYWLWILTSGCDMQDCAVFSQDGSLYSAGCDIDSLSMLARTTCSHGTGFFPVDSALCTVSKDGAVLKYTAASGTAFPLPDQPAEPETITLDRSECSIAVGETYALKTTISPIAAKHARLTWHSSDPSVASVSDSGVIAGLSAGSAEISVSGGSAHASCTVTVRDQATSISLSASSLTLGLGQKYTASYVLQPQGSAEKVVWSTYPANTKVVSVSKDGVIAGGTQTGKAYVIATTQSGKSARIKVTVVSSAKAVQSMKISSTVQVVAPGASVRLAAKVYPATATNRTITWKSSDSSIAAVDKNGVVTGVSKGSAVIYAVSSSGVFRSCEVQVRDVPVSSVTFKRASASIYIGRKARVTPTISPANASGRSLVWTSSDTSVATVDATGYIEAKSAGTTLITAACENGVSGSFTLIVREYPVSSVKIAKKSVSVTVGASGVIRVQVLPQNATNKKILWKSSNPGVVSVDENGRITAISAGTAVITATSEDNARATASCTVRVNPNSYKRASAYTVGKASAWITSAYFKGDTLRVQVCYYNSKPNSVSGKAFGDNVHLYISSNVVLDSLPIAASEAFTGTVPAKSARYITYTFSVQDHVSLSGLNLRRLHANSRVGR